MTLDAPVDFRLLPAWTILREKMSCGNTQKVWSIDFRWLVSHRQRAEMSPPTRFAAAFVGKLARLLVKQSLAPP